MKQTERAEYKRILEARREGLSSGLRNREDITIEKGKRYLFSWY